MSGKLAIYGWALSTFQSGLTTITYVDEYHAIKTLMLTRNAYPIGLGSNWT